MEDHRLGTHNQKMCADSLTGNTKNTHLPNYLGYIWNVFENSSIVNELTNFIEIFQDMYIFFLSVLMNANACKVEEILLQSQMTISVSSLQFTHVQREGNCFQTSIIRLMELSFSCNFFIIWIRLFGLLMQHKTFLTQVKKLTKV